MDNFDPKQWYKQLGLDCWCWKCADRKLDEENKQNLSEEEKMKRFFRRNSFMRLCPECGNKRCPKASDHELACTNSNEPGQPGSVY